MNTERLQEIETWELKNGSHTDVEKGLCVMEAVAYVAGEPHSDHPKCACPILTEYAIRLNDNFNTEHRQKLKPLIPLLVGTRATDEIQIARNRFLRFRNVTVTYPILLEFRKLPEIANRLRQFENTLESMAEASKFLKEKREEIYANADAYADAYAYAYANADALREKYSDAAIETLRMACEIGKDLKK